MTDFETLTGLVACYSPSGRERPAVAWLVARMQALGYHQAFVDEAGNAVGVLGTGSRQVVLLGHIDTVPGEIPVRLEGDVLHGRGSVDAKGPLAAFVDAVAAAGVCPGWQFVVIGAVEEERDSEGARYVAGRYHPDFAIVGEPNQWSRVALGYKGSAWAQIRLCRPQAHTASGEQTAAEAAVELWLKIQHFAATYNASRPKVIDQLLPTLRGLDSDSDDFEQRASLRVGVRLPPGLTSQDWYQQLRDLLGDAILEPLGFPVPAWASEKNTPLVRAFLAAIRAQGAEPRFVYKTGTADLNIVAPVWNCPAVVYGPGDSALDHTPHEHIQLEDYRRAVAVLTAVLVKLSSPPAG